MSRARAACPPLVLDAHGTPASARHDADCQPLTGFKSVTVPLVISMSPEYTEVVDSITK